MAFNFTPEQLAAAQEQMKNMSPEQIQEQMAGMSNNYAAMNAMGIDPSMMQNAMNMMKNNPGMAKMAAEQMKNMTPEQAAQYSKMAKEQYGKKGASSSSSATNQPLTGRGARAQKLKEQGTAFHKEKKYAAALDKYDDAILELDEIDIKGAGADRPSIEKLREACHLNAAACHISMKNYKRAIRECSAVISNKPNAKAYFRRATAQFALGTADDLRRAAADVRKAEKMEPRFAKKCQEMLGKVESEMKSKGFSPNDAKSKPPAETEQKSKPPPADRKSSADAKEAKSQPAAAAEKNKATFSGDPATLSIKEIKKLLEAAGVDYKGCTEKSDMVSLVRQHCMSSAANEANSKSAAAATDDREIYFDEEDAAPSGVTVEESNGPEDDNDDEIEVLDEAKDTKEPVQTPATEATKSSTPPPNMPYDEDTLRDAGKKMSQMSPEQMRMQAQMMRSMSPDTLRSMNPMMANLTDEQIEQAAAQMEMLAENPHQLKMASEMMKNMTPEQMRNMQQMQKKYQAGGGMPAAAAPRAAGGERVHPSTSSGASTTTGAAPPMPQNMPSDPAAQQKMAMDMVNNMDAKQFKAMMEMQRKMLKENPEMFEQMMKSNPAMAGLSRKQLEERLDMMADMDPERLKSMMGVAQKVQTVVQPMMTVWQKFDKLVCGQGKNIAVAGISIFTWYWIDYFFLS